MNHKPVYLDYNATTPTDPRVVEAMLPYLSEHHGNPSSSHAYGHITHSAVEKARKQVANFLGCKASEIVFTSGGSESNNYAIKGIIEAFAHSGNHIITSSVEHPAVVKVCQYLESRGCSTTYLQVDKWGMVSPDDFKAAITDKTVIASIMHANNEVGTLQPVSELARIAHEHEIIFHTDAAQSAGKIPVKIDQMNVDLLSLAGHKLYAPKGIGALYIRKGINPVSLIHGADHESGRRAGTENVAFIVALGKACELAAEELAANPDHAKDLRDRLESGLKNLKTELIINGHPELRLPNTLSVSFKNLQAQTILEALPGIAASAGAACHSNTVKLSAVLEAMCVPAEYGMGTVRFSTGRFTSIDEIDTALSEIRKALPHL